MVKDMVRARVSFRLRLGFEIVLVRPVEARVRVR